jgi:hypothetical protein
MQEDNARNGTFVARLDAVIKRERAQLGFLISARRGVSGDEYTDEEKDPESDVGFSTGETILAIIKSVIGAGVLYLPKGFAECGVGLAVPMLVIAYILVAFSSTGMLEISLSLKKGGYTDLAGKAYGPIGEKVSKVFVVAQQWGICLTYFVFVAHNLQSAIRDYSNVEVSLG